MLIVTVKNVIVCLQPSDVLLVLLFDQSITAIQSKEFQPRKVTANQNHSVTIQLK